MSSLSSFKVPPARSVSSGNGLTGGGNLTANRTITLGTPGTLTLSTTNAVTATSHTHDVELGLGTAAFATLTTTTSDSTAGRVLRVGDFGIGTEPVNLSGVDADWNDAIQTGFYRGDNTVINGPLSAWVYVIVQRHSSTYVTQLATALSPGTGARGQMYIRTMHNSVWGPWSTFAQTHVNVYAGNGLTGGGNIAANRTITLGTPGSSTASSTNAVTASAHTHAIDSTIARSAITITAGTGLTGGGNLTANRTLNVTYGTAAGTACQGNDARLATNIAQGTRTTTAVPITSSTGSNATLSAASTSLAGVMTSADKVKLNGIAAGAQVNVATNLGVTAGTTAGPVVTSSTGTNATLPTASGTASGVVTTGAQTWAGVKTFSSTIAGSINGNAATATTLQTARTINGVSFNGSANITVADATKLPLAGGTLTGTLSAAYINGVSASGIRTQRAATQDAIRLLGRAGGTGSWVVSLTPAALTASRTVTFPNGNVTLVTGTMVATSGNQTIAGVKTFSSAVVLSTAGTATTHAVRCDRSIATGSGLSGGGNLTANRTLTVDATVIRTTGNQTIAGIKTFSSNPVTTHATIAKGIKNTTISASAPSGGINGDIWMQY